MVGKPSPDGKTVDFEFLDVVGNMDHEHMHHERSLSSTQITTSRSGQTWRATDRFTRTSNCSVRNNELKGSGNQDGT